MTAEQGPELHPVHHDGAARVGEGGEDPGDGRGHPGEEGAGPQEVHRLQGEKESRKSIS